MSGLPLSQTVYWDDREGKVKQRRYVNLGIHLGR